MTNYASFSASKQTPKVKNVINKIYCKFCLNKFVQKLQHVFPLLFLVGVNEKTL